MSISISLIHWFILGIAGALELHCLGSNAVSAAYWQATLGKLFTFSVPYFPHL